MKNIRVLALTLLLLFFIRFIPHAFCQDPDLIRIRTNISISDISFNEGKLTLYGLLTIVEARESFGLLVLTPALYTPNIWDECSQYENGWCSLRSMYFSDGVELRFNLKEPVFLNDVLECGIVIGLNVTAQDSIKIVDPILNLHLREEWEIRGDLIKVSLEEASQYTAQGMWAINSSIQNYNIKEFYLLKILTLRKPNIQNAVLWLPPIFMFTLLVVSILLVYKKDLNNSLKVHLTVSFFSFGYLLLLREITPPTMTSIESFTLVDTLLCILISIIAIPWCLRGKNEEKSEFL